MKEHVRSVQTVTTVFQKKTLVMRNFIVFFIEKILNSCLMKIFLILIGVSIFKNAVKMNTYIDLVSI